MEMVIIKRCYFSKCIRTACMQRTSFTRQKKSRRIRMLCVKSPLTQRHRHSTVKIMILQKLAHMYIASQVTRVHVQQASTYSFRSFNRYNSCKLKLASMYIQQTRQLEFMYSKQGSMHSRLGSQGRQIQVGILSLARQPRLTQFMQSCWYAGYWHRAARV